MRSPARTWWLYCQFAVATMSGASGGMSLKTSMPMRWERMKPWPSSGSGSKARRTDQPAASTASPTIRSSSCWKGQAGTFALSRRSPLGMRIAVRSGAGAISRSSGS